MKLIRCSVEKVYGKLMMVVYYIVDVLIFGYLCIFDKCLFKWFVYEKKYRF